MVKSRTVGSFRDLHETDGVGLVPWALGPEPKRWTGLEIGPGWGLQPSTSAGSLGPGRYREPCV